MTATVDNPIIVALDGMNRETVLETVEAVSSSVGGFKLNSALHHSGMGTSFAVDLAEKGLFADLKVNDTPRTMGNTVLDIATVRPLILTIHLTNSVEALIAARKAAVKLAADAENPVNITLAGVTVLTSICEEECQLLMGGSVRAVVLERARRAVLAKVPAIVCGGPELEFLKQFEELEDLERIVPALYPEWYPTPSDQKRPMTPGGAIKAGADRLVIGSAITKAPTKCNISMEEAVQRILAEIEQARKEMTTEQQ